MSRMRCYMLILLIVICGTSKQASGDLGIGDLIKTIKSGNSNDVTVSREKRQSHPVIYRGLGSCTVTIPNVGKKKLNINIAFSENVFDFTPKEPFPPLYLKTIEGKWFWWYKYWQPSSFRSVQLSNTERMIETPECNITFKYNYDFYKKPTITCTVETT